MVRVVTEKQLDAVLPLWGRLYTHRHTRMQCATLIHTHARKHHVYMSCGTQRWSRDLLCCDWPSILAGTAHAWKKPGGESDRFDTGIRYYDTLLFGGFQVGAYGIGVT